MIPPTSQVRHAEQLGILQNEVMLGTEFCGLELPFQRFPSAPLFIQVGATMEHV